MAAAAARKSQALSTIEDNSQDRLVVVFCLAAVCWLVAWGGQRGDDDDDDDGDGDGVGDGDGDDVDVEVSWQR